MKTQVAFLSLLVTLLFGCARTAGVPSQTEDVEPHPVQTVCSILEPEAPFSAPHLVVRGQFVQGMHEARLMDSACDGKALFLHYVAGGPHFLFCESEALTREFGCPGGMNGPIVTVRGVLSLVTAPKGSERGHFAVEEVVSYESARTGKIVSP